jgi:hypothetical protein
MYCPPLPHLTLNPPTYPSHRPVCPSPHTYVHQLHTLQQHPLPLPPYLRSYCLPPKQTRGGSADEKSSAFLFLCKRQLHARELLTPTFFQHQPPNPIHRLMEARRMRTARPFSSSASARAVFRCRSASPDNTRSGTWMAKWPPPQLPRCPQRDKREVGLPSTICGGRRGMPSNTPSACADPRVGTTQDLAPGWQSGSSSRRIAACRISASRRRLNRKPNSMLCE